ncbi:MAG TPA: hypothetical protein VII47_03565, partial [Actinomycetota bacterium]
TPQQAITRARRRGTVTTSLHLIASVLLALVTALLAVVASRPARERWRDLRAWEDALNQRPVDWGVVVLSRLSRGRPAQRSRQGSPSLTPRPWTPGHSSRRSPA